MARVDLLLRNPIRTAQSVIFQRPIVVLDIKTSIGNGIGECSALAGPYYTQEYLPVSEFVLRDLLLPYIMALPSPLTLETIWSFFDKIKGYHQAKAAIEMALLDLLTKSQNISLLSFLSKGKPKKSIVPASMTIGIQDDIENTIYTIGEALGKGYRRIKCKISPNYDINLVKAIFSAYQHEANLELFLDGNESYSCSKHDMDILLRIGNFDERIVAIEQPLQHDQIFHLAKLRKSMGCHLLLDESISDLFQIAAVGELGLCSGVVIKPSKLGGVFPSLRALELAEKYSLQTSLGGMYEAGIARSVSLVMESLEMITLGGDLGPSENYYVTDITAPHLLKDGFIEIPDTIGLGVQISEEEIFSLNHSERTVREKTPFGSIYPPHHFFHD